MSRRFQTVGCRGLFIVFTNEPAAHEVFCTWTALEPLRRESHPFDNELEVGRWKGESGESQPRELEGSTRAYLTPFLIISGE